WAGWAAAVYRMAQTSAAAARSDVIDEAYFPNGADATRDDVLRTLSLLKKDRLSMFADPAWQALGVRASTVPSNGEFAADARITETIQDAVSGLAAAHMDGRVTQGIGTIARSGQLAIVDPQDRVAGLAEFSFVPNDSTLMRLRFPRKRGF